MTRSAASASATPSKKPSPSAGGRLPASPSTMSPTADSVTTGSCGVASAVGAGLGSGWSPVAGTHRTT